MIKINNITKKIKNKIILDEVTFEINERDVIGIIGENGSGKSTLLKIILGLNKYDSGEIIYENKDFNYFPDVSNMFTNVKPIEIIEHYCNLTNIKLKDIKTKINEVASYLNLNNLLNNNMKTLSTGEKKRVYMLIQLIIKKTIFFYDEPTDNLDEDYNKIFKNILSELINKGLTIVIVSHSYDFLERFINKLLVIKNTKVINIKNYKKGDKIINHIKDDGIKEENFTNKSIIKW
ncbi:ABC transporter ATP-binding protein [Spiroplasma corruscae]|uniref:ABC transporter ATP-binding protein n=1 Tax=Spiroplasma corruscae TaxID=216934 RepID=A0A222EPE2_9MOLU|nr:ATP-binding cassette domain-containing protein [Spiroplasma corruscae]ASP28352.1 ABC transporter ATP-binding protein [Spiroplasma corruscae]